MSQSVKVAVMSVAGILLLLAIAFVLLWNRFRPDEHGRIIPPFEKIDITALQPFAKDVGQIQRVSVFEGLPHQSWERDLLASELRSKDTFKSRGHHFYRGEIKLTPQDQATIQRLTTSSSTFQEWRGMKMCGGYHPDWLVRWTEKDGTEHDLYLCFGCHEAKIYGPGYKLYCDIRSEAYAIFESTFAGYVKQRPKPPWISARKPSTSQHVDQQSR